MQRRFTGIYITFTQITSHKHLSFQCQKQGTEYGERAVTYYIVSHSSLPLRNLLRSHITPSTATKLAIILRSEQKHSTLTLTWNQLPYLTTLNEPSSANTPSTPRAYLPACPIVPKRPLSLPPSYPQPRTPGTSTRHPRPLPSNFPLQRLGSEGPC